MAWKGAIGKQLQSIKFMACPTSPTSAAVRTFWESNFQSVKHMNPSFLFMIRPVNQTEPYMIVEYDFNRKVKVPLAGMDVDSIEKKIQEAVEVGEQLPRSPFQSVPKFLPSVVE